MQLARWYGTMVFLIAVGLVFSSSGCGNKEGDANKATDKGGEKLAKKDDHKGHKHADKDDDHKDEKGKHDHSGWWCGDHGVPEHICSLCLPEAEVKKKFKDVGDWCKIHDRAQSQCFICDSSKYAKFEAMYVAKYGKKPERPPEKEFGK